MAAITVLEHPVEREAYTVDETAHALNVGRVTVYRLIKEGRLRRVKLGTRTVVPRDAIERILRGEDARP